jgi:histidinol-phosphate aminotransferase
VVRDVGIAHHLRVTAGTADETSAFLTALAAVGPGAGSDAHTPGAPS